MRSILLRVAVVAFAIIFTALTFNFWGDFSLAMNRYLDVVNKDDAPKPPPPQKGVVTMTIIQPTQPAYPEEKTGCHKDKSHPCPE
jgi:hypothetical protein